MPVSVIHIVAVIQLIVDVMANAQAMITTTMYKE
jgi:hypothetical protein